MTAETQKSLEALAVDATTSVFLEAARALELRMSADQRVGERDAAALLGYHPGYLKTLRQEGKGPASYVRGIAGCRVSYRLADLAEWVESARHDR